MARPYLFFWDKNPKRPGQVSCVRKSTEFFHILVPPTGIKVFPGDLWNYDPTKNRVIKFLGRDGDTSNAVVVAGGRPATADDLDYLAICTLDLIKSFLTKESILSQWPIFVLRPPTEEEYANAPSERIRGGTFVRTIELPVEYTFTFQGKPITRTEVHSVKVYRANYAHGEDYAYKIWYLDALISIDRKTVP